MRLYKTEVIRRRPWCKPEGVEFAPLEWVWWFNGHCLIEPPALSVPGRV